ncbi:hypothetical protein NM688_g6684 [Phlebia brevispora]|uniref:Uncharacterized protein n=1 Tax=Phlebia brevispora TaxID=194682 RepID=A0ACC1SDN2_9APHY|nr:hypothetical protein NM688_g6684 [Phlebia brevispora]
MHAASMNVFESLPVELIAEILGELDVTSLIVVSYLSRRLHSIASDSHLNPWRKPILRNLRNSQDASYERSLQNLSVRRTVPRQNWVDIISLAKADWLLFEATLPNLKDEDWEECFNRRFLPSWRKWKKEGLWKQAFLKVLHRVWHRSNTSCTSDESWTRYILIRRNGVANELEASSRNFDPVAVFEDFKVQSNLDHLETRVRLVVELADVRIIALGVLNKPRGTTTLNPNARAFLHPPGIEKDEPAAQGENTEQNGVASDGSGSDTIRIRAADISQIYRHMSYPLPALSHANYPFHTPGGEDKRWLGTGELEENGMQWVGGLMITAQILGTRTKEAGSPFIPLQDRDLIEGPNRSQYAAFTFADLDAIAPWLEFKSKIDGPGLGND